MAFSTESAVVWAQAIKSHPIISVVKKEAEDMCPAALDSSKIGATTLESAALQAARSQGWRECMNYIFNTLPGKRSERADNPFIDTSKD